MRTKTSRELAEDIELWEDICLRYKCIDKDTRYLIAKTMEGFYKWYSIDTSIHMERWRCLMHVIVALVWEFDNGMNAMKHFDLNHLEMEEIMRVVDIWISKGMNKI